jgi:alpha-ribazole phosphatase
MSKVVFIRPGMTESGKAGRKLGVSDEPLLGEERVRLAERTEQGIYPAINRLYACPAVRCRETAALAYPRMPAIMLSELTAFDCGEFEGLTQEELNHNETFLDWASSPNLLDCPGGDNLNWYAARCIRTLRFIVGEMESFRIETAAIVAHGLAIDLIVQRVCLPRTKYRETPLTWGGGLILNFNFANFTAIMTGSL